MDTQEFDERSLATDVIGREPGWILRYGMALLAAVVAALFGLSWWVRYPDQIHARVVLTTAQPPVALIAEVDGRILSLAVGQGERVAQGQLLLSLDSAVDDQQLDALETTLVELRAALATARPDPRQLAVLDVAADRLGPLQAPAIALSDALQAYTAASRSAQQGVHERGADAMRQRYATMQHSLAQQRSLLQRKVKLQEERLARHAALAERGLLGGAELAALESQLLDHRLQRDELDIQIENTRMRVAEIDQELAAQRVEREESIGQLAARISQRLRQLDADIAAWRRQHRIVAPVAGQVSIAGFWSANQHVRRGDVLLTVDAGSAQRIGKLTVTHAGAGKIAPGQRVEIDLDSLPAREFGSVSATVLQIAPVPSADGYAVDLALPEPLVTSHGRAIAFTPNLPGKARIITKDRALLERFLDNLFHAAGRT